MVAHLALHAYLKAESHSNSTLEELREEFEQLQLRQPDWVHHLPTLTVLARCHLRHGDLPHAKEFYVRALLLANRCLRDLPEDKRQEFIDAQQQLRNEARECFSQLGDMKLAENVDALYFSPSYAPPAEKLPDPYWPRVVAVAGVALLAVNLAC